MSAYAVCGNVRDIDATDAVASRAAKQNDATRERLGRVASFILLVIDFIWIIVGVAILFFFLLHSLYLTYRIIAERLLQIQNITRSGQIFRERINVMAGTLLFGGSLKLAYRRVFPLTLHHPASHFAAVTRKLLHDFETEVLIDVT